MSQLTRFIMIPALIGALLGIGIILFNSTGETKPGYASAVELAAPAVVNIHTRTIRHANPICRFYKQLCQRFGNNAQVQRSLGSGVILQADGYIVTNEHVVKGADEILVMFANGQIAEASLIGTDPHTDLAVIQVTAEDLPVIPVSSSPGQVGDIALAIGNPFGLGHSVSQGIISAFSRAAITDDRPYDDFIQTDAAISPGNSGGALVDYRGHLLGINTMIVSQSGGSEGIGFAIPAYIAADVLSQIVNQGRVIRGWLGVELAPNFDNIQIGGLVVNVVAAGGPAFQAGIRPGDVLLSVNQLRASTPADVTDEIANTEPGSELDLEVLRGNQRFRATAIAGELPPRN
ncbi:MAG: serine protease DegS [Limisphaerales bacterium]|jgi:serine protease DegS